MKNLVSCVIIIACICGCYAPKKITPNPPVITDSNMCDDACYNLNVLNCQEGTPVSTGKTCSNDVDCSESESETCQAGNCVVTCETFCIESQKWGVWLNPTCVANITSCKQIETTCRVGENR